MRLSAYVCAAVLWLGSAARAQSTLYGVAPFFTTSNLYTFDPATGAATLVGSTGSSQLMGVTTDNSGRLLALTYDGQLLSLDPRTGGGTMLARFTNAAYYEGDLAVDRSNNIAYISEEQRFFKLDLATNTVSLAGSATYNGAPMSSSTNIDGLAFRDGDLYGFVSTEPLGLKGHLVRIDKDTLAVTDVGTSGLDFAGLAGLAYDPGADVFYVGGKNSTTLYRLDPTTGAATAIGVHGLSELSGLTMLVPEPTAVALLPFGFLAAASRPARRRHA